MSEGDNALGLDFADKSDKPDFKSDSPESNTIKKEKEKPYVNPERVKTGGIQRVRFLSFSKRYFAVFLLRYLGQVE